MALCDYLRDRTCLFTMKYTNVTIPTQWGKSHPKSRFVTEDFGGDCICRRRQVQSSVDAASEDVGGIMEKHLQATPLEQAMGELTRHT